MRPIVEKKKFEIIHIVYIIIIIICILAIGITVYTQFFKDERLGIILGITKEDTDEEYKTLKESFLNLFSNDIEVVEQYVGNIKKIRENDDIIILADNTQEQNQNYTLDLKIPYFNIDSTIARECNVKIKSIFKDKLESIISSSSNLYIIYNVKYKAYINENILSLVILSELKEGDSSERIILQTYNYNLKENKEVTIEELLNKKNIDKNNATHKIKSEIESSQEQNTKLSQLGYNVVVRDSSSEEYNIENAQEFFIGQNGYLYIVYPYGNNEFTSEMDVIIFR